MPASDTTMHPSLFRRLTAMLYDSLLIVALVFVVNGVVLGVMAKMGVAEDHTLRPWQAQIVTLACVVTFFTLFWIKSGQTLGMQAWRIKLVDFDGNTPSVALALLRCGAALLSAACLGLGFLWCLVDPSKRYWHDYLSHTELILLPKKDKKTLGDGKA
ncbi:MAG: RDD family protein [Halioglobus sp.]|nr:RDD family protein [Halioglobus sp.]